LLELGYNMEIMEPTVKPYKKNLIFDYPSTARIKFKISNCYESDLYPAIYRIACKRLNFTVPKKFVIISDKYVYIPLDYYKIQLAKFYKSISN
jgi:hypothetical protein